jgi:uncharacterized membrane protein
VKELVSDFLWRFLAGPVVADALNQSSATWQGVTAYTGYNPVNTGVWVGIALVCLGGAKRAADKHDIDYVYASPFVMLGGLLRFIEDAAAVPFEARLLLVTPVIYFLVAGLFVACLAAARRFEDRNRTLGLIGVVILSAAAVVAASQLEVAAPVFGAKALLVPAALTGIFYGVVRGTEFNRPVFSLAAFSQFFGGAVSMLAVTNGYPQKQLLAQLSTDLLGPGGILVLKSGLLGAGLFVARDADDRFTEVAVLMALVVVGLATGLRVYLRVLSGL